MSYTKSFFLAFTIAAFAVACSSTAEDLAQSDESALLSGTGGGLGSTPGSFDGIEGDDDNGTDGVGNLTHKEVWLCCFSAGCSTTVKRGAMASPCECKTSESYSKWTQCMAAELAD